jgi:hypothetical protein
LLEWVLLRTPMACRLHPVGNPKRNV